MIRNRTLLALTFVVALAISDNAYAEGGEDHGAPAVPRIHYLEVPPVAAPMFNGRHVSKYMFMTIQLEIAATANADEIKLTMPRIRDTLLAAAYLAGKENADPEAPDLEKIRGRLLAAVQQLIGAEKVTGLLFTETRDVRG